MCRNWLCETLHSFPEKSEDEFFLIFLFLGGLPSFFFSVANPFCDKAGIGKGGKKRRNPEIVFSNEKLPTKIVYISYIKGKRKQNH